MKKILLTMAGIAVLMGSQVVSADDSSNGCGLGWQVSNRQSLLSSAIRETTNWVLPNSFSMTSGTSGCAKHDIVKNDEKAVEFAVNNYDSLIVEMAEGHGEFLNGFAQALGCGQTSYGDFGAFTQTHYKELMSTDGVDLYRAVRTKMESSSDLNCVPSV